MAKPKKNIITAFADSMIKASEANIPQDDVHLASEKKYNPGICSFEDLHSHPKFSKFKKGSK